MWTGRASLLATSHRLQAVRGRIGLDFLGCVIPDRMEKSPHEDEHAAKVMAVELPQLLFQPAVERHTSGLQTGAEEELSSRIVGRSLGLVIRNRTDGHPILGALRSEQGHRDPAVVDGPPARGLELLRASQAHRVVMRRDLSPGRVVEHHGLLCVVVREDHRSDLGTSGLGAVSHHRQATRPISRDAGF